MKNPGSCMLMARDYTDQRYIPSNGGSGRLVPGHVPERINAYVNDRPRPRLEGTRFRAMRLVYRADGRIEDDVHPPTSCSRAIVKPCGWMSLVGLPRLVGGADR